MQNENRRKLVIFEGFRQNGLQIRIQRNFLRISTPVKIYFRHFFEHDNFLTWKSLKTHHFWGFHAKWTAPLNSAYFFTYFSTGQNWFLTFFSKMISFSKRAPLICPHGPNFSKKWVPEGFKSRFELLERWSSTRAFDWCALRHQSFDLRRVTAILLQQKNFDPDVIYYVFWEEYV